ncbi:MAG: serine hydrolase [Desulfobacterales bacterium]|nr:MAG: serine hydrolase [Desulfobacterales bacterium]
MKRAIKSGLLILILLGAPNVWSYPLDGYPATGVLRLEGFRLAQQGKVQGIRVPSGAMLGLDQVDLRLNEQSDFQIPAIDSEFLAKIENLLGDDADNYGVAVLDLTDAGSPRYVEHRGDYQANPGSVGKLVVALGVFQALADLYPNDVGKRQEILRDTLVTADQFIQSDHHKVPLWTLESKKIDYRPIQIGDRANLWTYLDWMLSASSNAAASIVIKELMLLVQYGRDYPVSIEVADTFFKETPRKELAQLLSKSLQEPLTRNGLDLEHLRQGSFFTWKGKQLVPGTTSYASPRELMRFLVKMEQGQLVDPFSSREIKRLIYMTQGRIRYASAPVLFPAAVYFKSGSLYKCKAEPNFKCGKYMGNVVNMLNSVAVVEYPADDRKYYYMVVVMSNVLRKNSAVAHQTLATRIHRLIEAHHSAKKD